MTQILSLTAENVKRLTAVRITPKGALTVVAGPNDSGKSSVLDSILYALCGEKTFPPEPVRQGQEKAEIVVELDSDLTIRRYITAAGTTGLEVKARDGARYPSPQKMLDELTGKLTFDPMAFLKQDPEVQAKTLRKLVGLDTSATDAEIKQVFDERTAVNRRLTEMRGAVAAMVEHKDAPAAEVSSASVLAEIERGQAHNQRFAALNMALAQANGAMSSANQEYDRAYALVKGLETQLAAAKVTLATAEKAQGPAQQAVEAAAAAAKAFQSIDVSPLKAQLQTVEQTNAKVRANAARTKAVEEGRAKKAEADKLTARLEALEKTKADALAAVRFPVEGLSVKDERVLFNNVPLSQVNTAGQIRVGVAISAALAPKLKVILIREGSMLDDANLAALGQMAEEMGLQCWVERCQTGTPGSIEISDGEVVGAQPPAIPKETPKRARKTKTTETSNAAAVPAAPAQSATTEPPAF